MSTGSSVSHQLWNLPYTIGLDKRHCIFKVFVKFEEKSFVGFGVWKKDIYKLSFNMDCGKMVGL